MNRRQAIQVVALGLTSVAIAPASLRSRREPPAKLGATPAKPVGPTPVPTGPFSVPPLTYAYDALEPHIDAQTMQVHHDKHHQPT
jgi:hypothetical protein